jgi:hypothetical protein
MGGWVISFTPTPRRSDIQATTSIYPDARIYRIFHFPKTNLEPRQGRRGLIAAPILGCPYSSTKSSTALTGLACETRFGLRFPPSFKPPNRKRTLEDERQLLRLRHFKKLL